MPSRRRGILAIAALLSVIAGCPATPAADKQADASADAQDDSAQDASEESACLLVPKGQTCASSADCPSGGAGSCDVAKCASSTCTTTNKLWQAIYARQGADGGDDSRPEDTVHNDTPAGHMVRLGPGEGHAAALLGDGSIVTVGISNYGGGDDGVDVRLARVDRGGTLVLDKRLRRPGTETATSIASAPEGNLYAAATVDSERTVELTKMDSCGATIWSKELPALLKLSQIPSYTVLRHRCEDLGVGPQGQVACAGWHTAHKDGQWGTQAWFVMYNKAGTLIQFADFDTTVRNVSRTASAFYGLDRGADGTGWIAVGHNAFQPLSGSFDGWLVRLDEQGNLLWDRLAGGESVDMFYDVLSTPAGYFAVGHTDSYGAAHGDPLVARFDDSGQDKAPVWQVRLPWLAADQLTRLRLSGDALFAAGWSESFGVKRDGLVARLDAATGEVLWTRVFGHAEADRFDDLVLRPDGSLVAVGQTQHGGAGGPHLWVYGLDANGNSSCSAGCTSKAACDDKNACTLDQCAPASGACVSTAQAAGAACDDGKPCTVGSSCATGQCTGGVPATGYELLGAPDRDEQLDGVFAWPDGTLTVTGRQSTQTEKTGWLLHRGVAGGDASKPRAETQFGVIRLNGAARLSRFGDHFQVLAHRPSDDQTPLLETETSGKIDGVAGHSLLYRLRDDEIQPRGDFTVPAHGCKDIELTSIATLPQREFLVVGAAHDSKSGRSRGIFAISAPGQAVPALFVDDGGGESRLNDVVRRGFLSGVAGGTVAPKSGERQGLLLEYAAADGWDFKVVWTSKLAAVPVVDRIATGKGDVWYVAGRDKLSYNGDAKLLLAGVGLPPSNLPSGTTPTVVTLWSKDTSRSISSISGLGIEHVEDEVVALLVGGWLAKGATADHDAGVFGRFSATGATAAWRMLPIPGAVRLYAMTRLGVGYALVGRQVGAPGGDEQGLLVRVDRFGNLACHQGCAAAIVTCNDGKPCTSDDCSGTTGACVHAATPGCN